jgi:1,4-alpha-glucan branching enzyme
MYELKNKRFISVNQTRNLTTIITGLRPTKYGPSTQAEHACLRSYPHWLSCQLNSHVVTADYRKLENTKLVVYQVSRCSCRVSKKSVIYCVQYCRLWSHQTMQALVSRAESQELVFTTKWRYHTWSPMLRTFCIPVVHSCFVRTN